MIEPNPQQVERDAQRSSAEHDSGSAMEAILAYISAQVTNIAAERKDEFDKCK